MLLLACLFLMAEGRPGPIRNSQASTPPVEGGTSFLETFARFDHGADVSASAHPHRWRTVYGFGGPLALANRQMSAGSLASDDSFAGADGAGPPLGLNPFALEAGVLTIKGDRVPAALAPRLWNKPYYGGIITTRFSFSQRFGYFEAEARLPVGKGMWPAFWLMPVAGQWPAAGEIDILEGLGAPHEIHCTSVHGARRDHFAVALPFDVSAGYHRYGVLWGAQQIVWFVDRRQVASAPTPPDLTKGPMYLLLNLAVGGAWGGYPDAGTVLPGRYQIRQVAVWPLDRAPVGRARVDRALVD